MKRIVLALTTMVLLTACTPKAYTDNLKLGNEELQKGQYQAAVADYKKALMEKGTDEVEALLDIAQSMADSQNALKQGEFEAAIFALNKVIHQKSPEKFAAALQKEARAKLSDLKKAAALYESLKAQNVKGNTLLKDKQFDQAIEVFRSISETDQYTQYIPIKNLKKEGTDELAQAADFKTNYEATQQQEQSAKHQEQQPVQAPAQAATQGASQAPAQPANKAESSTPLTRQEAVDLVRQYLNINSRPDVFAEYDHDNQKGDYVIHVYEIVIDNPQTKQGHTNTWGWYAVNKTTKAVYDAMTN